MFLKEAKSPASPTKEVDKSAALSTDNPIEVDISPNKAAISKAVPSAIPNWSNVVLAKSLTSLEADPKATSTLFIDSSKSEAILIAAAPAIPIGRVSPTAKRFPTPETLVPNDFNLPDAVFKALFSLLASPIMSTLNF